MPAITQKLVNELDKSCWGCGWHRPGGINLLGRCGYFEHIGKEIKEVPSNIVDLGCSKWKNKVEKW